jgi:hypothetical protein
VKYEDDIFNFNWEQQRGAVVPELAPHCDFAMGRAMNSIFTEGLPTEPRRVDKITVGWLFRWCSVWVGVHYSSNNRRFCINLIPFVTFWVALKGGYKP